MKYLAVIVVIILLITQIKTCGVPNWKYPLTCKMKSDAYYLPFVGYQCDYWITDSTGTTYHVCENPEYMVEGQRLTNQDHKH
jgi:hypothetical protein